MGGNFFRGVIGALAAGMFAGLLAAAEPESNPRDTLVYKDGDRVQGKLLSREGDVLVFKSDRFGELRVPAAQAVVVLAEKPAAAPTPIAAARPGAANLREREAERDEAERVSLWERFSPWLLTAKVRNFFGPWHGRFAFTAEAVTDTSRHDNLDFTGNLQRKWAHDALQFDVHYDYSDSGGLTTTDLWRGDASWRHDFLEGKFAQYRPTVEYNRANVRDGVLSPYVLLHQEIGGGYALLSKPGAKVRLGLSENLFDTWDQGPPPSHNSHLVESIFAETEFHMPWRMTMTQRLVWYPLARGPAGWENHVELTKKLTETLSLSVQHEIRRNNPDGSAQDYQRLRLLIGLDF